MEPEGPEAFVDAVRDRLVGALTLAVGSRAVGEELAQEALVRAWERWPHVATLDAPDGWVFRVGFNLASSWRRRRAAEWRANRRTGLDPVEHHDVDGADVAALRAAVAGLPDRQRAVIVARYYLGYDVAGTAELLGCAPGTVKAATSHALANLRRSGLIASDEASADDEVVRP